VIFRREVPPQQSHGGEGHLSRGEQIEDRREAAGGARGLNSVARRVFRQPQRLGAIAEEGAIALGRVDGRAVVEGGQVGHEVGAGLALITRKHVEAREQVAIRQSGRGGEDVGLHVPCV